MNAYLPTHPRVALALLLMLVVEMIAGFAVARIRSLYWARALAWLGLFAGLLLGERLLTREPAGFRMVGLIAIGLLAMKVIVTIEDHARGAPRLSFLRWVGFASLWLGMKPQLFARRAEHAIPGAASYVWFGIMYCLGGSLLLVLANRVWAYSHSFVLTGAFALVGLSFLSHFGLCNVLVGLWRFLGVECHALFRAPVKAQNLSEFWARRWNLAFSEMTAIAFYKPLAPRIGRGMALMVAFVASGLLHELAISVPVRAGFGMPLLYFALHGALVLLERAYSVSGRKIAGWSGRLWTVFWLVAPLPLLFHRPFLVGIVWPIIGVPHAE